LEVSIMPKKVVRPASILFNACTDLEKDILNQDTRAQGIEKAIKILKDNGSAYVPILLLQNELDFTNENIELLSRSHTGNVPLLIKTYRDLK
jgi:hypothetical protein